MSPLKRVLIPALVGGAVCGLIISLALLAAYFYTRRPKGWDTHALMAKHTQAGAYIRMNEKLEEASSGVIFTVDVENTTPSDIRLPTTVTIMQATKATGALHGSLLKLSREYFLPARHVVSIGLENDDLCAGKDDPQSCFDRYFKEEAEIVIFNETGRYELHIPMPAFTPPTKVIHPAQDA